MPENLQACLVFCTHSEKDAARDLARKIVQNKLAACVQILEKGTSFYEWEGNIEESAEFLMVIKTFLSQFDSLKEFIIQNHPYDVPEIIAVKIEAISENYLQWMSGVLK